MATTSDPVSTLRQIIDLLNQILRGSDDETVNVDGVVKPTVSKAIADHFEELRALMSGRLAFETLDDLRASGAPESDVLAQVWDDPDPIKNGIYGWNGSSWVRTQYSLENYFAFGAADENGILPLAIDDDQNVLLGVDQQGQLLGDGTALVGEVLARTGMDLVATADENFALAFLDGAGNVVFGIRRDGRPFTLVEHESGMSPLLIADESFALAIADQSSQSVVAGIRRDGSLFLPGVSVGTDDATVAVPYLAPAGDRYHLIIHGQSLSNGQRGDPGISGEDPFGNEMFVSGMRQEELMENESNYPENGQLDSLVTLNETDRETVASGIAAQFSQTTGGKLLISSSGVGGSRIETLMRDGVRRRTNPERVYYPYRAAMAQTRAALQLTQADNGIYAVYPMVWIQGESDDAAEMSAETYRDLMIKLKDQWNADMRAIVGQSARIPMISYQTAAATHYGEDHQRVAIGQQQAAEIDPDIVIASPIYFIETADGVHLDNHGYRWLGSHIGKVLSRLVTADASASLDDLWRPLSPKRITRQGRIVQIEFWIPEGPLVLDTDLVTDPGDYGFEVWDSSGRLALEAVELVGDRVRLRTATDPSGDMRVRYAYSGTAGNPAGPATGSRGCLRDSDPTESYYKDADGNPYPLYNWLIHFDKGVDHE